MKHDATANHFAHDEGKLETQHNEMLRSESDSEPGVNPEYRTYDPKWEKKTLRKIDARLLIIREQLPRAASNSVLTIQSVFVTPSV